MNRLAATFLSITAGVAVAGQPEATEAAHAHPAAAAQAHEYGIWKAAVPAHDMHAEFDNFDTYGLAVGAQIKADCSLNWVDPDDGLRYCFASGTSLVYFLEMPKSNLASARATWKTISEGKR